MNDELDTFFQRIDEQLDMPITDDRSIFQSPGVVNWVFAREQRKEHAETDIREPVNGAG